MKEQLEKLYKELETTKNMIQKQYSEGVPFRILGLITDINYLIQQLQDDTERLSSLEQGSWEVK